MDSLKALSSELGNMSSLSSQNSSAREPTIQLHYLFTYLTEKSPFVSPPEKSGTLTVLRDLHSILSRVHISRGHTTCPYLVKGPRNFKFAKAIWALENEVPLIVLPAHTFKERKVEVSLGKERSCRHKRFRANLVISSYGYASLRDVGYWLEELAIR